MSGSFITPIHRSRSVSITAKDQGRFGAYEANGSSLALSTVPFFVPSRRQTGVKFARRTERNSSEVETDGAEGVNSKKDKDLPAHSPILR